MGVNEITTTLTDRFGPIDQPLDWYGVNEHGLAQALEPLPHIINREGIFSEISNPSAVLAASAYIVARLTNGKPESALHWAFGADRTHFGIVATIGEIAFTEALLGRPFEAGRSSTEKAILKANFVSPAGLIATVRQAVRGKRGDFIVNRAGMAELAVQEMLPEARAIIVRQLSLEAKPASS